MSALELKVPPPVVALLIGTAMWFGAGSGPSIPLPLAVRVTAFAIIGLLGGAVALAGDLEFKRAKTTINPLKPQNTSSLVTSGVYRFTRNPMYLGLTLILIGWVAFLCAAWPVVGPIAFVLYITRLQIAPEERVLSGKFGATYAEYAARVRRWL